MSRRGWADRILDRALPDGPSGYTIRGDLRQERERRAAQHGRRAADRWYLRQSLSIWLWATRDRVTGVSWRSGRRISHDPGRVGGVTSDLKDGMRVLRRAPGYSAAVVVTLGVAMAATVSVFTVIRGVLLRDLPYPEPDQLVRIDRFREGVHSDGGLDYPTFLDWQDRIEGLVQMAVYQGSEGVFVGDGFAEVWRGTAGSRDLRGARIASARPSASRSYGRRSRRTHSTLAGAQVALAVVLLTGSGLLLRSFGELSSVETGFLDPSRLLMVEMGLGRDDYQSTEQILGFHRRFFDGLSELPGVEHVGLSTHLPFSRSRILASVVHEGEIYERGRVEQLGLEMVNGDYREALGLPLLRGRDFSENAGGGTPLREVLINEAAATLMWPGQDPIGKRFSFDVEEGQVSSEDTYYTVVGVVPDVMDVGLDQEMLPRAYYDLSEFRRQYGFISGRFFHAIVRSTGDPYALVDAVRDVVLRQAFWVVSIGGLIGVLTAGAISPVLESMLFQVSERDPLTLAAVLAAAIVAALAAAYLPALRASRIDPVRVLRQD